jgi:ABC-2 type transport system permease protein
VLNGNFRVGIIIREGTSDALRNKIRQEIEQQFPGDEPLFDIETYPNGTVPKVEVYFDPVIKSDFRHAINHALRGFSNAVEARMIFSIYTDLLTDLVDIDIDEKESFSNLTEFDEQYATNKKNRVIPNSAQHNVPAWTVFAMFFIVIPLAGNIVKERESGLAKRLMTMPGSNLPVILGKASVYFIVGIIQALLMAFIGVYLLPLFGTPALNMGSGAIPLIAITMTVSLAASGYGILIGSIATSQEQSSIFGSISVMILAAIGGIWVPTFMMSDLMVAASRISPLNWALTAYYDVILRNSGMLAVVPQMLMLLAFFVACITIAFLYNRYKRSLS